MVAAELGQPVHQARGQVVPVQRAGGRTLLRAWPVGRHAERFETVELPTPVRQLCVYSGLYSAVVPHRVVVVVQVARRQVDTGVAVHQFVGEQPDRPAVGDNVVLAQQEQVLVVTRPEQDGTRQRPGKDGLRERSPCAADDRGPGEAAAIARATQAGHWADQRHRHGR